jgi:hypothetical protein
MPRSPEILQDEFDQLMLEQQRIIDEGAVLWHRLNVAKGTLVVSGLVLFVSTTLAVLIALTASGMGAAVVLGNQRRLRHLAQLKLRIEDLYRQPLRKSD